MEKYFGTLVRRKRQAQGITLERLAEQSDVSRAALSKIERGERTPSLVNALQIAEALGTPLAELIGQAIETVSITRAGEAHRVVEADHGAVREALLQPYGGTEVVRYTIPPHSQAGPFPAHEAGTREGFVVIAGEVEIHWGDGSIHLAAGDAAAIPADQIHQTRNLGSTEAIVLIMIGRPNG